MQNTRMARGAVMTAIAVVTGVATLTIACSSDSKTASTATAAMPTTAAAAATTAASGTTLVIRLSDYKITGEGGAAIGTVKAGTINFEAHNDGAVEHEFVLLKNDADPASLEVVDNKIDEEADGAGPGEVAAVAVGDTKTEAIDLAPGTYIYVCNLPSHYEQGMHGRLIVV